MMTGLQNKMSFPCKLCASKVHIAPLCDNTKRGLSLYTYMCANASEENSLILPIVSVTLHWGNKNTSVNCLLNGGSQFLFFQKNIKKSFFFFYL